MIFPRVLFDGFLRHYLEIEVVVERELKVVGEYFVSLMTSDQFILNNIQIRNEEQKKHGDIGFGCLDKSFDQHKFSILC